MKRNFLLAMLFAVSVLFLAGAPPGEYLEDNVQIEQSYDQLDMDVEILAIQTAEITGNVESLEVAGLKYPTSTWSATIYTDYADHSAVLEDPDETAYTVVTIQRPRLNPQIIDMQYDIVIELSAHPNVGDNSRPLALA